MDTQPRARRRDPLALYVEAAQRRRDVRVFHRTLLGALRLTWQASRRGFVVASTAQVVGAVSAAALVVIGKWAIEALIAAGRGDDSIGTVVLVVVLLAAATALGAASTTLQHQQQRLLGEEIGVKAWERILEVTARVPLEVFEAPRFYDQLERIRSNAVNRPLTVTTGAFGILGGAVGTVGILIALLTIDPLLVPLLLLAGVPSVLLSRRASSAEFEFVTASVPVFRAREYLREVLTGRDEAKEIRAFGAEVALRTRHDQRAADYLSRMRHHVRRRQMLELASVGVMTVALALSLATLVWFLSIGRITLPEAGAAALGIRLLSTRLTQTFQSMGSLLESSVFLDDLERFLNLTLVADGRGPGNAPGLRRAVTVRGLGYTYPGRAQPAVSEVDLTIGAGEVVAIVGENGSGKTTLAKLIAGLYTPATGSIWWDDSDTAELEPADVRRACAVVFQDFVRYQLSVQENIGLGDPNHVDDEAKARLAARMAGAAEFVESLPEGYETVLSREFADGVDLSLGQWQRIALARALRRDAPLVILDEPSSSLDPRAEQALFADVRATLKGRSAVLISHRYSTVRSADRIYVMREGRIVEAGSHATLMELEGLYAELFTLQAKAYL